MEKARSIKELLEVLLNHVEKSDSINSFGGEVAELFHNEEISTSEGQKLVKYLNANQPCCKNSRLRKDIELSVKWLKNEVEKRNPGGLLVETNEPKFSISDVRNKLMPIVNLIELFETGEGVNKELLLKLSKESVNYLCDEQKYDLTESNSFLCELCGEEGTGERHKSFDENYNFTGEYICHDCFNEIMKRK